MPQVNNSINYIEMRLDNVEQTKSFYTKIFGWEFQDWGPEYISFSGAGIDGGMSGERKASEPGVGSLVVLYSDELDLKQAEVKSAGMKIVAEIFDFPGGRRFHFVDPSGNEIAIWGPALDSSDGIR